MVGRYFELVVLFWLVPLYVITRGFYTGYTDGFITRAFGKVWGFIWALILAKIIAHYVSAEINATTCDRVYSFFSLWLLSFTSIHGCGVYIAKKYTLNEKIHSRLEANIQFSDRSPVPLRGSLPAGSACRVAHGGPALMQSRCAR